MSRPPSATSAFPSAGERRYTVTYHDDRALAIVYGDNDLLANWLRLRLGADAAWPSAAPVPRLCDEAALAGLVEAGLVELEPSDRYRMPALDAERVDRIEQASKAGRASVRGAKRGPRGRFAKRTPPTGHQRAPTAVGDQQTTNGHQRQPNPPDQRAGAKDTSPSGASAVAGEGRAPAPGWSVVPAEKRTKYDPATDKWVVPDGVG